MFLKADLHIHSKASDGALNPREIIMLAKDRGVDTIAIADHNSVAAINEASEAGEYYSVSVIPAVELSTRFNGESIHVLGYFKDLSFNDPLFLNILRQIKSHNAYEARKLFGGARRKNSFSNFFSVSEGIQLLKAFRASVVLAHPVRISKENLPELLNMPFDGIEAKYCHCSDYISKFFIKEALNRFSFYTGGSDFHTDKINDTKHCIIGEPYLNPMEIQRFLKYSGALVLGSSFQQKALSRYRLFY